MPPYKVEQRGESWVVVDTANGVVLATRSTEESADDKVDRLELKDQVATMHSRLPTPEMTAEEKAAAYDKMIAEREKEKDTKDGKEGTGQPPPPPPKPDDEPPPKPKSRFFGDAYT